jgi:hypothetical protein
VLFPLLVRNALTETFPFFASSNTHMLRYHTQSFTPFSVPLRFTRPLVFGPQPIESEDATAERRVHHPATANLLTLFLYCQGTPDVLRARIAARKNHFMGAQMLTSQLATLEDPTQTGESGVFAVNIDAEREVVARNAREGMRQLIGKELGLSS